MEDRQIRIGLQIFFSIVALIICTFIERWEGIPLGLILANLLAYAVVPTLNFISSRVSHVIYGSAGQDDSYEGRFYQTDLDQARKMVRESRWNEAISCYRKIVEFVPNKIEARFELAKVYQKAGYHGLALLEYQTIRDSKDKIGDHHPFVMESERMIGELKKVIEGEVK